jgi:hypothetical protein
MNEYKGIYYKDNDDQHFYEGGAHFKYIELYKRLEKLYKLQNNLKKKLTNSLKININLSENYNNNNKNRIFNYNNLQRNLILNKKEKKFFSLSLSSVINHKTISINKINNINNIYNIKKQKNEKSKSNKLKEEKFNLSEKINSKVKKKIILNNYSNKINSINKINFTNKISRNHRVIQTSILPTKKTQKKYNNNILINNFKYNLTFKNISKDKKHNNFTLDKQIKNIHIKKVNQL